MHKLLAERLNHYVHTSGLTYDELEEQSKIPRSTIYRYLKKPPNTPDPDIVAAIATATGHTKEEAYEGIVDLPIDTGEYVAEITVEENEKIKDELNFERNLQRDLADQLGEAMQIFKTESRKNDAALERTQFLFDECRTTLYQERKDRAKKDDKQRRKDIAILVLAVSLTISVMYGIYTFIAFDLPTPDKGIWPPFWLK